MEINSNGCFPGEGGMESFSSNFILNKKSEYCGVKSKEYLLLMLRSKSGESFPPAMYKTCRK